MKRDERRGRRLVVGWGRGKDANIDAELRFHFDERVAALRARGASEGEARAQALVEFGDVGRVRTALREIDTRIEKQHRRAEWWEAVAQDLTYVFRGLRNSPGFTAMVVVTLALAVGANAAIFSVLDRLLLLTPPEAV